MLKSKAYWLAILMIVVMSVVVGCTGPVATLEVEPTEAKPQAAMEAEPTETKRPGAITPELIEAAQAEGSVVLYTGAHTRSQFTNLIKRFEETYGITVEGTRKPTWDTMTMIAAEQQADNIRADIVGVADLAALELLRSEGLLAKYQPENADDVYEVLQVPEGDAVPFTFLLLGIAYNTDKVTGDMVPDSWQELAGTDWDGRVAHGNPATSGTAAGFVQTVTSIAGWELYEKLGEEGMLLQDSSTAVAQLVVTGEALVALPGVESQAVPMSAKGEPIAMSYPSEGVPMNAYYLAMLKDAPHPNAARLLLAFHLMEETQQYLVDELASRPVLTGVTPPTRMPALDEVKVVQPDFGWLRENREQMVQQFMDTLQR